MVFGGERPEMTKHVLAELLLPFVGTSLGAGSVFFLKKGLAEPDAGLFRGGHGGGLRLESADPRDGTGGGYGAAGVPPGGHRLLDGRPVPAGAGQDDPPPASERR